MQIVLRKVVVEAGQLSRGAKIAGRVLFVVSALCLLGGGISIFLSVSRFGEFLERESTTADQIKQQVGHITYSLGASQMFLFIGLGLMVLGIGCHLFGRRHAVSPPTEKV